MDGRHFKTGSVKVKMAGQKMVLEISSVCCDEANGKRRSIQR